MIEGTITKTGANVLGGDMPGQVYFGVQGPPGGHYIPNVNQIADDTAEISFTPSTNNMPSVDPVQIKLPKNKESGGNVDLEGYATEQWVRDQKYLTEHQDISHKLDADKLPEAVNEALAEAKASGEFDGEDGKDGYTPVKGVDYFDGAPGKDGIDGKDGSDGYTPVKGKDYFDGENGQDGTSVTITKVTESTEDGGSNVVEFSDGKTLTVRNGKRGSGESIPDYVIAEAKETAKKVLSHQSEDCFTLAWLSDLHIGSSYKFGDKWVTDDTSVIEAGQGLHEMSKTAPCDMVAIGGDLAAGTIMTQHDDGLNQLDTCMEYLRPTTFHTPTLYLVGNHDDVPFRGTADRLTRAEMFSRFGRKNLLAGAVSNDLDKGCNYGYLDFENRKMRVIYLDTHDKNGWESTNQIQGETTGSAYMDACNVSAKQLHWLANVALDFSKKESPSEWGVIVLSHTQLNIHTGNHTYTDATSGNVYTANTDNVITILTAYLGQNSGSITLNGETATYDFSGVTESAYLYGCINGHRHCYEYREYGGKKIPGISCPNVCAYSARESQDGNTYEKTLGTGESCSFNVITIDRKNGKIYADNHGAGIDRVFDVVVYGSYTNLVPTAVKHGENNTQLSTEIYNGVGYMNDMRISGMNSIVAGAGYVTTGIMKWRDKSGYYSELKPIYIKGALLDVSMTYVRAVLIQYTEAGIFAKELIKSADKWNATFTIETLGDMYYKLTPIESGTDWYNIRYFMFSLYGTGENLIITVDEPI